jgi:hypothetical protein
MSASILLSQNVTSGLDGVNLQWQVSNMATLKELSLIYYSNTSDSNLKSLDVSPVNTQLNLNLESGISYSFQLQVSDTSGNVAYSNTLQLTAPYELSAPVILSFLGKDGSIDLVLQTNVNNLTTADSVEFVLKKSDNSIFWIIKSYAPSGNYSLSGLDNVLLTNNQSYRIACMYQPSESNLYYASPSDMSNSMTVTPTNLPNVPTSLSTSSVGTTSPAIRLGWVRPSDFNEWSSSFSIVLRLFNYVTGANTEVTLTSDVVEYTFTGLSSSVPYKPYMRYVNQYGTGPEVSGDAIVPTTVPNAPILASIVEGDEQLTLNWSAPSFNGDSPITGYIWYRNGSPIETPANALSVTDNRTGQNGVAITYSVKAVNAIGTSAMSNVAEGSSYGDCSVENVVTNGKTLQMTFKPNGRAIQKIFIVAMDSNPSEADVPTNFFYEVPAGSISQVTTDTFNLSKTFSTFSDNISFHCVICNNANSSAFLRSA